MNFSLKLLHSPRTKRKRAPSFQVKTRRGGTARAPAAVLPERVSFTLTLQKTSLPRASWCGDGPSAACLGHCRGRRRLREKSADPLPEPWLAQRLTPNADFRPHTGGDQRTFQVRARPRLTACGLCARLGAGPPDAGNALPRDVLRNLSPLVPQARLRGGGVGRGGPQFPHLQPRADASAHGAARRHRRRPTTRDSAQEPGGRPPLTEVIQREAALVRGPRLEALGPKIHGRRHDGGAGAPE